MQVALKMISFNAGYETEIPLSDATNSSSLFLSMLSELNASKSLKKFNKAGVTISGTLPMTKNGI